MSIAVQADPAVRREITTASGHPRCRRRKVPARRQRTIPRQRRHLRHLCARRRGLPVPCASRRIAEDFRLMAALGFNTVRVYTPPRRELLDEAARHGLRVMVGLPWSQHVAFLDNRRLRHEIDRDVIGWVRQARRSSGRAHVRARQRDSARHRSLARARARRALPADPVRPRQGRRAGRALHLRQLSADRISRSVVLRRLRVQRLSPSRTRADARTSPACSTSPGTSRCCWRKPARTAFAKAKTDRRPSRRCTSARRSAKAHAARWRSPGPTNGGAAGSTCDDWAFGLVDRDRIPKPAAAAVAEAFADAPFPSVQRQAWPRVSVVVCAYNAADTLEDCLDVARAVDLSGFRNHPGQRRLPRSDQRDRPRASAGARHRHSQRRPERGPQRRARGRRPARSSRTRTPTRASIATGSRFSCSRS